MLDAEDAVALSFLPRRWRLKALDAIGRAPSPDTVESVLAVIEPGRPVFPLARRLRRRAAAALDAAHRRGIRAIAWGEGAYPPLLAAVADAPLALWIEGTLRSSASRPWRLWARGRRRPTGSRRRHAWREISRPPARSS